MAILFAILAGLCWGIGELFTRHVLHTGQIGPLTAITIRSAVALPLIALIWFAGSLSALPGLSPEPPLAAAERPVIAKLILGSGIIAGAMAMIFFYVALSLGEIGRVKPVAFALAPATAVLLGWMFLGERMTLPKAAGVTLILAGVLLLTRGAPAATAAQP
ncbi:MAG TPA: EamA family transporter [Phycisphaerales bacterium]|nr:EamA family transporter [Phycisphaerales bacterium]HMP38086.1 EamA family transporter [Phycisphaerales bacterium]